MINYINTNIVKVSAHTIGNKSNEGGMHLSKKIIDISDNTLREVLLKFFIKNFTSPELYSFTFSNDEFELNPIFNYVSKIFDNKNDFHKQTINIAKYLYDCSNHPNIKSGEFYVSYFDELQIEDELTDAIGLFKVENKDSFLKLNSDSDEFKLSYDNGINTEKLDKGCIIFNTDQKNGFKICIVDKINKGIEAQYWKNIFLNLKPRENNYHNTKEFLLMAKSFVTGDLLENFNISRTDQLDLLNRSLDYFKEAESFNEKEFSSSVFEDKRIIKSFENYRQVFYDKKNLSVVNEFDISDSAVKKISKNFKSVLKLDNNFHIYIHGDRNLIQSGVEKDGRKFYKIYYDEES